MRRVYESLRKTEIVAWTEEWNKIYFLEEKILKGIMKEQLLTIFHIGSTSIPTIGFAKPIIDILITVKDIKRVDLYNSEMVKLGYEPHGENGIVGRRYFTKGKEKRTHHVHIFQAGNESISTHLNFKEYLLNNPLEAKKYGDIKINLKKQFPTDHYKYQEEKQQFAGELAAKANKWAATQKN